MRFKKNKVWLALDESGEPLIKNGKVRIKYQIEQSHEYWVHPHSVVSLDTGVPEKPSADGKTALSPKKQRAAGGRSAEFSLSDTVIIYTDGASSGNPGPSGIGVILRFGDHEKEISKHIGVTTNNIAELQAIKVGLLELKKTHIPVKIYTDSAYAHGVLTKGWKAKKNRELIESIKQLMSGFKDLELIHVRGHNGLEGNERADRLATSAAQEK